MNELSRRDFLKALSLVVGAVTAQQLIAACGKAPEIPATPDLPANPLPTPRQASPTIEQPVPTQAPTTQSPTAVPQSKAQPTPTLPLGSPDLVVARGGEPEILVQRALAALGGMEAFVPAGARVIIKPNICVAYHTYEYAATTNPWVVGTLVRLCLEAGASSVQVMDFPFGGSAQEAYTISGIEEQVKAAGGQMALMPGFKYVSMAIPDGKDLKKTDIFDDILKTDVLINVPIAKHHNLARLTLGMKNLLGVIRDRSAIHRNLGQRLADLTSLIRPTLTVVDAVRILTDHGPSGGNLNDVKQLDTVIISQDIVAADSYAATLFGMKPEDLAYIRAGAEMGLGRSDLANLRIEEIQVGG